MSAELGFISAYGKHLSYSVLCRNFMESVQMLRVLHCSHAFSILLANMPHAQNCIKVMYHFCKIFKGKMSVALKMPHRAFYSCNRVFEILTLKLHCLITNIFVCITSFLFLNTRTAYPKYSPIVSSQNAKKQLHTSPKL